MVGMYIVRSGELEIVDGKYVFETVSPGGIVGEMVLLDSYVRRASARAISRCTVVPIDERQFLAMVQKCLRSRSA